MKRLLTAFGLVLLIALAAQPLRAEVTGVSVTPSQATTALSGGVAALTWRVDVRGPRAGGTVIVSSPSVAILEGATILEQDSRVLSRSLTLGPLETRTVIFTESLRVSSAVAQRLARSGGAALFQRSFSDSAAPGSTVLARGQLVVAGAGAAFSFSQLSLAFEGGDRTRVLPIDEELTAIADLTYSGNGTLQAEWRVSAADGLRGSGIERRLQQLRRPLVSAGEGRTRLESPPLPTNASGLYEVAFVLLEDGRELERVAIRYFVLPGGLPPVPAITLLAPEPEAALTPETRFAWRPVEGAAAYQIEVFDERDGVGRGLPGSSLLLDAGEGGIAPVAGRVVPGDAAEARLDEATLRHLEPGVDYRWRVRALGPGGELLGASPYRPIRR